MRIMGLQANNVPPSMYTLKHARLLVQIGASTIPLQDHAKHLGRNHSGSKHLRCECVMHAFA
jgi:hypothetical protein